MRIFIVGLLLIGMPGICIGSGQTSSFQCPNGIVSIGDTREEVANKCGTPNKKMYTEISPVAGSDAYKEWKTYTYESQWTYDPGPNGFIYILEFWKGKVRF